MKWLYIIDLFFWYLQKVSFLVVMIWLGWQWWTEYQIKKRKPSKEKTKT